MIAILDCELTEIRRINAELQQRLDEALAREAATAEVSRAGLRRDARQSSESMCRRSPGEELMTCKKQAYSLPTNTSISRWPLGTVH
jgi:hypothetical protein